MAPINFKVNVHSVCLKTVSTRIHELKTSIAEAEESMNQETKSSMGDKYETGREVIKAEINKQLEMLSHFSKMSAQLERIDPRIPSQKIGIGSLIITRNITFYIAVSLGRIEVNGQSIMVISDTAPILEALKEFDSRETIQFKGNTYQLIAKS